MNNIITKSTTENISNDFASFIGKTGKYGCIVVGMFLLYDLCIKAMDKGCTVEFKATKDDGIEFNLGKTELAL